MYCYNIIHIPGKTAIRHHISQSRETNAKRRTEKRITEASIASYASQHTQGINVTDWETVQTHAASDQECSSFTHTIINEIPKTEHELSPERRIY